jgi:4-methyl-5(b-hydroxyethyl)-thiazole monophosphate biosynthesis
MKKVAMISVDGFEEIEYLAPYDMLKRAGEEAVEVTTVSATGNPAVKSRGGMLHKFDKLLEDIDLMDYDCVIIPGGAVYEGWQKVHALFWGSLSARLTDENFTLAAICRAPGILEEKGLLDGYEYTGYPGTGEKYHTQEVMTSHALDMEKKATLITGKGPGLAIKFGAVVLKQIVGAKLAHEVLNGMLL